MSHTVPLFGSSTRRLAYLVVQSWVMKAQLS